MDETNGGLGGHGPYVTVEELREQLKEATYLIKELSDENERLWAENKKLKKKTWRERLISWIDPEPEGGNV